MPIVLRSNEVTLKDSQLVPFGLVSDTSVKFFDVESANVAYYPNRLNASDHTLLGFIVFEISKSKVSHSRTVYNIWNLVGDYGGFRDGIMLLFIFLLGSLPEHMYIIRAI